MSLAARLGAALMVAAVIAALVSAPGRGDRPQGTSLLTSTAVDAAPPVSTGPAEAADGGKGPSRCLGQRRLLDAARFARARAGRVSFAFLDECGRLVGAHRYRLHTSASLVKAMLLVGYLRRDVVRDRALGGGKRSLLTRMIEASDNDAADTIFGIVGEAGLSEVAEVAGMRRFRPSPSWGGSGITAGDQASFFARIERYVPRRHEAFALSRLAGVIASQRWGIPEVAPPGWRVRLKGGWYPASDGWRVNQAATLRRGSRSVTIAVLSDGDPSFAYGQATIAGVAKRLVSDLPR